MLTFGNYLYPNAVILPVLALLAVLLDIPPLVWHMSQHNIAAWSLILWIILANFFNFTNPLIWPTDDIDHWWDGNGLCDVEVRVFLSFGIGLPAAVMMVMRKLAKVMDTRNITVAPTQSQRVREKALDGLWCWGYPLLMALIYYIVQPIRYWIFGISGCVVALDESWLSIVLIHMWTPITVLIGSYYAGILVWRLYRYRKDFHRLIAARNTTKSRFMRLFVMSMIIIVIFLPYSIWIFYLNASQTQGPFVWSRVHGPDWNSIIKAPVAGQIRVDKWGQIAGGYLTFFVFGTGTDANNTYKRMLCAMGLGKIFPSLHKESVSGASTPTSSSFARKSWFSIRSKAKSFSSKNESGIETLSSNTMNSSISVSSPTTPRFQNFHQASTVNPALPRSACIAALVSQKPLFFRRLLTRGRTGNLPTVLPSSHHKTADLVESEMISASTNFPGVYTYAWASNSRQASRFPASNGVYVIREVRQNNEAHTSPNKEQSPEFLV
ncbi:STE3-domain-containing protein [Lindgomyces ingoldianus]|uniref:STE3-domain-containing protein n=1 Tax=Lindgomyces ingoldianus TaxID=673940 RepID=A0ACB6R4F1_9PLEO|nr:STE3-domain-containing protein [Lindgomyces ingoldianus]KAF2474199.1 STE3-domain-containing protein [Lindgomyces ingoldianus]